MVAVAKMKALLTGLEATIARFAEVTISAERLASLEQLSEGILPLLDAGKTPHLNFICTHNSRRSQLAEAWGHAFIEKFDLNMTSSSGGTEATAFFHSSKVALQELGFLVDETQEFTRLHVSSGAEGYKMFSKTWDNSFNPQEDLVAVMTCSHAEQNCPFIPGAILRIALPFEDPKRFDDTPQAAEEYRKTALLIGAELNVVFTYLSTKISR